jgi:hypothetical protein
VKTCDFFEFRRLADNTTRAASTPNTNPLPFSYAPLELAARPIAYSTDGGDAAQQAEVRHFLANQLDINSGLSNPCCTSTRRFLPLRCAHTPPTPSARAKEISSNRAPLSPRMASRTLLITRLHMSCRASSTVQEANLSRFASLPSRFAIYTADCWALARLWPSVPGGIGEHRSNSRLPVHTRSSARHRLRSDHKQRYTHLSQHGT